MRAREVLRRIWDEIVYWLEYASGIPLIFILFAICVGGMIFGVVMSIIDAIF